MDNGNEGASPLPAARSRRRFLTTVAGVPVGLGLAGCSSDDVDPHEAVDEESETDGPDSPTPTDTAATEQPVGGTATAALGEVIEGWR